MIFQEFALVERLTVMENVLSGRLGYVPFWRSFLRRFPQADVDKAFQLLERVGLTEHVDKRADALSGGQRQRVGIARALEQDPELLLVDEPTASLDPKTSRQIMRLICEICAERQAGGRHQHPRRGAGADVRRPHRRPARRQGRLRRPAVRPRARTRWWRSTARRTGPRSRPSTRRMPRTRPRLPPSQCPRATSSRPAHERGRCPRRRTWRRAALHRQPLAALGALSRRRALSRAGAGLHERELGAAGRRAEPRLRASSRVS